MSPDGGLVDRQPVVGAVVAEERRVGRHAEPAGEVGGRIDAELGKARASCGRKALPRPRLADREFGRVGDEGQPAIGRHAVAPGLVAPAGELAVLAGPGAGGRRRDDVGVAFVGSGRRRARWSG